ELREYVDLTLFEFKEKKINEKKPTSSELRQKMMYGVTTGFGALKNNFIEDPDSAKLLQKNIVLSHAGGVGPHFDPETTKAIMVLRANTLASGYCGVGIEVAEQL